MKYVVLSEIALPIYYHMLSVCFRYKHPHCLYSIRSISRHSCWCTYLLISKVRNLQIFLVLGHSILRHVNRCHEVLRYPALLQHSMCMCCYIMLRVSCFLCSFPVK